METMLEVQTQINTDIIDIGDGLIIINDDLYISRYHVDCPFIIGLNSHNSNIVTAHVPPDLNGLNCYKGYIFDNLHKDIEISDSDTCLIFYNPNYDTDDEILNFISKKLYLSNSDLRIVFVPVLVNGENRTQTRVDYLIQNQSITALQFNVNTGGYNLIFSTRIKDLITLH